MVFSELYSAYYNTVAKVISKAIEGDLTENDINMIISENAFSESMLYVLPAIKEERWQVITKDLKTPIKNKPTMPLTTLEKQWLKAVSLDPRFKLFGAEIKGLEDVEPLFRSEDYRVFDKYADGDPYEDEKYIKNFRTVLQAVHEKRPLEIEMVSSRNSRKIVSNVMPVRIEYSEKDDKFRLISVGSRFVSTINIAKIKSCKFYEGKHSFEYSSSRQKPAYFVLKVKDKRRALERCMLHFAHCEKQAEKTGENEYMVKIKYYPEDSMEMVIRVLSFGPLVEVVEPPEFRNMIIEKLKKQQSCGL